MDHIASGHDPKWMSLLLEKYIQEKQTLHLNHKEQVQEMFNVVHAKF